MHTRPPRKPSAPGFVSLANIDSVAKGKTPPVRLRANEVYQQAEYIRRARQRSETKVKKAAYSEIEPLEQSLPNDDKCLRCSC